MAPGLAPCAILIPVAGSVMTALVAKEILLGPGEAVLPVVPVSLCLGSATFVVECGVIASRVERITLTSAWQSAQCSR